MRQPAVRISVFLMAAMTLHFAWAESGPRRIWILPFEHLQADSSLDYLKEALPALVAVTVSQSEEYAVVERRRLDELLTEQFLTLEGLTSPETRRRIGKLLGATVMITGSFVQEGGNLLITMRASDLETGIITAAAEGSGPADQPGELLGKLYRRLARDLDRRLPALAPDQIDQAPLANLHFMKGLGHYYSARYSHALAEFMLAAEDEQLTDVSRLWLANAYLAQEQYAHAYLELSRLARGGSSRFRESEVAAKMRLCEKHLKPEDVKIIRELAAPAGSLASPAFVTPRPKPNEPYRFFGDRRVTVPLLIHAPEREGLSVRAELVQLSSNLAASVASEIEVPLSAAEVDLTVPLPAVKRETDFELRFRSRRPREGVWQPAGRVALRVYPADLLDPVRVWAQSHPLRVKDEHGSMVEFFRRQGIPVDGRPGSPGVTVYVGARAPVREDETAVLFTERETEIPHVLIDRTGRATTIKVEMRLLDRLATDPLAQKIFLEVFRLLHEQESTTKGDVR